MRPAKPCLTILLACATSIALSNTLAQSVLPTSLSSKDKQNKIASLLNWQVIPGENLCDGNYGQPKRLDHTTAPHGLQHKTTITSRGPNFLKLSGISTLKNHVIVKQPGREVHADLAHIRRNKAGDIRLIELSGHVHLYENGKHIVTDHLTIKMPSQMIRAKTIIYHISSIKKDSKKQLNSWGTAHSVQQDHPGVSTYLHASYTTCRPLHPTWTIQASKIKLDQNEGVGTIHNGLLKIKGIPLLPLPYLQFPIDKRRRTGLLTPSYYYETGSHRNIVHGNVKSFILRVPVYFNLAPNYDDLLQTDWWSKRGFFFDNTFRYLNRHLESSFHINWIPHDAMANDERTSGINAVSNNSYYPNNVANNYIAGLNDLKAMRWKLNWTNAMQFGDRWKANLNINRVSDAYFFRDYSVNEDAQYNLLRSNFTVNYIGNHWQDSFVAEDYQALHRFDEMDYSVNTPYERQPELTFSGFYGNWLHSPLDLSLNGQFDNFVYSDPFNTSMPQGTREHARAELAYPIYMRGGSITPSAYIDLRSYQLNKNTTGFEKEKNYAVPILNLDSQWTWGSVFHFFKRGLRNEFSLHANYLYVPNVEQGDSPNFDSYLLPYNYTQLFTLNRYTGYDRLSNANQVSVGLHDGVVDPETGTELATLDVGIANSFTTPKVCLTPNCILPTTHLSPLVTDTTYKLTDHWSANVSAAWNLEEGSTVNNINGQLKYSDTGHNGFSFGYSYAPMAVNTVPETFWLPSGITKALTAGAQLSLTDRLKVIGYFAYDFVYDRSSLGFVGLQYDSCCLRLKLGYRRLWDSSYFNNDGALVNNYKGRIMFTLELKGLGDAGTIGNTNSMKRLLKHIPGYNSDY